MNEQPYKNFGEEIILDIEKTIEEKYSYRALVAYRKFLKEVSE